MQFKLLPLHMYFSIDAEGLWRILLCVWSLEAKFQFHIQATFQSTATVQDYLNETTLILMKSKV